MAFEDVEKSVDTGFPTELYKFVAGSASIGLFTSSDEEVVFAAETYVPSLIKRTQPGQTGERLQANIQVTVPRDNEIVSLYRIIVPSETLFLTIFRFHRPSVTPGPTDTAVFWQGRVRSVKFVGSEAVMDCEPLSGFLKRDGLRSAYQSLSNHMLYGPDCTVDRNLFKVEFNIDSISADQLEITSTGLTSTPAPVVPAVGDAEAHFYDGGGFVERVLTPEDKRLIVDFNETGTRDKITILSPFESLGTGEPLRAFAGCLRTRGICDDKFDNIVNFGGWPFIPIRNPFESGLR